MTMASKIPLTQGKLAIIDDADLSLIKRFKWSCGSTDGKYASTHDPDTGATILMHRLILGVHRDSVPEVDHRNSDGYDNRRSNLRVATRQQNAFNKRKKQNTSSKFIGVYWNKINHKWCAQYMQDGKAYYVGSFADETEAAKARDAAIRELRGDFAKLNFPTDEGE
jgi:hypothetical protein